MNRGKKPEPIKRKTVSLKGLVFVKRREDDRKRINEELEFLIEMEDRIPRREENLEQLVEEVVDNAMAELRRALPPEELEIYEKCYRIFKRTNPRVIRDYTAEQILQRSLNLRGEE